MPGAHYCARERGKLVGVGIGTTAHYCSRERGKPSRMRHSVPVAPELDVDDVDVSLMLLSLYSFTKSTNQQLAWHMLLPLHKGRHSSTHFGVTKQFAPESRHFRPVYPPSACLDCYCSRWNSSSMKKLVSVSAIRGPAWNKSPFRWLAHRENTEDGGRALQRRREIVKRRRG